MVVDKESINLFGLNVSFGTDSSHNPMQRIARNSDYSNDYINGDFLAIDIILCIQWLRLKGGYVSSTIVHYV